MQFLDFFAGVGGFRRGLEMAGHKCIGFCEWDKYATASYTSMHLITDTQREFLSTLDIRKRQKEILKEEYRNGEWYSNDIRNVDARSMPYADCWCFGAPCQDFSVAGKRAGLEGDRSSLVREVFRILGEMPEEKKPEWLLYENVKGMFSSNKGFDYLEILFAMDELGYDIEWQLFNSKDWGVPQNRERVYTVGHLRTRGERKIFPITGSNGENSFPVEIIGHRNGYRRNTQTFSPKGITESLDTGQGGGRGHHVGIPITMGYDNGINEVDDCYTTVLARDYKGVNFRDLNGVAVPMFGIDKSSNNATEIHVSNCLSAREDRGVSKRKKEGTAVAIPILTPDRANKRQNGRRFKDNGDEMFALTAQDRHGVGVSVSRHSVLETKDVAHCLNANDQRKVFGENQESTMIALNISENFVFEPFGSIYAFNSETFGRKIMENFVKTIKSEKSDTSIVMKVKEATKAGYSECKIDKNSVNLAVPGSETRRGRVGKNIANTLDCSCNQGIFVQVSDELTVYAIWYPKYECYIAIRKLTPKECFRLQGWTDDYFEKAAFVNFDSQLYKQAGNGVTVNVVYEIGKRIN